MLPRLRTVPLSLSKDRHKELDEKLNDFLLHPLNSESAHRLLRHLIITENFHYPCDSVFSVERLIDIDDRIFAELQEAWTNKTFSRIRSLEIFQPSQPRGRRWITLSLIRHAQCTNNVTGALCQEEDAPLTQYGKGQATALGERWANVRIDKFFSSPLVRAYKTAQAISRLNPTSPSIITDTSLVEHKPGTGLDRDSSHRDYRPAGGESYADVAQRAKAFLDLIISLFGVEIDSDPDVPSAEPIEERFDKRIPHVVIVSHGVFLLELYEVMYFYNDPGARRNTMFSWKNTSFARFTIGRDVGDDETLKMITVLRPPSSRYRG